jgi:hypothetical protein
MTGDAVLGALKQALGDSPSRAAATIATISDPAAGAGSTTYRDPEWFADIYAGQLNNAERSTMRDALELLLVGKVPARLDELIVPLSDVARNTALVESSGPRQLQRFWNFVLQGPKEEGHLEARRAVAELLAEAGPVASPERWNEVTAALGESSILVSAEGVLRNGVRRFLSWLEESVQEADQTEVLTVFLNRLLDVDGAAVAEVMRRAAKTELQANLVRLLARYDLSVPMGPLKETKELWPLTAKSGLRADPSGYLKYAEIDSSGATLDEALSAWTHRSENAPWPEALTAALAAQPGAKGQK